MEIGTEIRTTRIVPATIPVPARETPSRPAPKPIRRTEPAKAPEKTPVKTPAKR
jgi:hypothetical protein